MRIMFTGGGTGGHIFPCIAVIDKLKDVEVHYIGEFNSMEEKITRERGISFHGIHAGKLRRYFDLKNIIDAFKVPVGFVESLVILGKLKPKLLFAKGGYVSFPVVAAAATLGIPVWLHESDSSPGLGNKLCAKFASKIFLSFEESRAFFPKADCEVVGNPIRTELLKGKREKGFEITGFSPKSPVILIVGGSTGAMGLNKMVEKILPKLVKKAQIVHVTGRHASAASVPNRNLHGVQIGAKHYRRYEFLNEELPHIYAIADLIVSRAGSGSIFEALAVNKPMILVPLPAKASRGDQIENAEIFEKNGWAVSVDQEKTSPAEFLGLIERLLEKGGMRNSMIENQKKVDFAGASEKIASAIMKFR